jgi:hypothetical protein
VFAETGLEESFILSIKSYSALRQGQMSLISAGSGK